MIIIGDLNARMPELGTSTSREHGITVNPDRIQNAIRKDILLLCESEGLLPVNHIAIDEQVLDGGLTYKKGKIEVSQLDWILCTPSVVKHIKQFDVHKDGSLLRPLRNKFTVV